jgi:DNA replication protein DnaC
MNTPMERLQTALETLGLKAVQARLENLLEQASKKETSYADFLDELLSCEVEARRTRYLRARLQLAHFPFVKTFEQFDFSFQPSLDERQIRELRSLRFIHEASNVILLGPPGVGKTHLSVALAEEAIRSGMGAYFITAHDLAADLGRAYREGRRRTALSRGAGDSAQGLGGGASGLCPEPKRPGGAIPLDGRLCGG